MMTMTETMRPLLDDPRALIDELTVRHWREAGVNPGMRVLVAGRGLAALSQLASAQVGRRGMVAVEGAPTMRADALLLRSSLLHHADPCELLRDLLRAVQPGAPIVVQETDDDSAAAAAARPTPFDRCELSPLTTTVESRMALRLSRILRAVGLPTPRFALSTDIVVRNLSLQESGAAWPNFVGASLHAP